jgi:hypothetical protein
MEALAGTVGLRVSGSDPAAQNNIGKSKNYTRSLFQNNSPQAVCRNHFG